MFLNVELILGKKKESLGFYKLATLPSRGDTIETFKALKDKVDAELLEVKEIRHIIFADSTSKDRLATDCVARIYIHPTFEG